MSRTQHPLAGVLLSPEEQSHLPRLFAHWLSRTGAAGSYVPVSVAPEDLGEVIKALPKAGFVGLSVASDYQVAVLDHADLITDRASLMGAANTLIFRKDGKVHADNTESVGFIEALRHGSPGWDPKAGPVVLFGAGKMARRAAAALLEVGVPELRVTNRTRTRAEALRSDFGTRVHVFDWLQAGNLIEGATSVVNATILGKKDCPAFRVPLDALVPGMTVMDLVTDPRDTALLRHAREAGCTAITGAGLELYQAAPGFTRWFGMKPPIDEEVMDATWGNAWPL